ncbi:MAG: Asp/Glu racemase, partial [Nocardioides sp.]|nr:Asp/Glu racemase [Nocardioides sp.]
MTEPLGVGVIVPYDFALDDELWRWAPPGVRLYVTRTPHEKYDVGLAQARAIGTPEALALAAASIATPGPLVAAYMCTSGSFVQGRDGEQRLVEAMGTSGIPAAVTTSGALIEALLHLGAMRIGVATPYDDETGGLLAFYLRAAGLTPAAVVNLGLTERIWTLTPDEICDLVRRAAQQPCDAV